MPRSLSNPNRRTKFGITLITGADVDPVSVAQAKTHMRVTNMNEDLYIGDLIRGATLVMEGHLKRALITQQWKMSFDATPFEFFSIPELPNVIDIVKPPLLGIDSIKFFAEDDVEQNFDLSNIRVDLNNQIGRISLKEGKTWPTGLRNIDAFHINFTAGYGPTAGDVPHDIRRGIIRTVATWFEHREDVVVGTITSMMKAPALAEAMVSRYRIFRL